MSRNSSGTYTLPSGNPVVSGTLIEASWANTTLSDLASAMTDSLSRSGQGGMTAALRLYDGTSSVPGLAWGSETTTGWYRAGSGDMRLVVTGSEVMKYLSTGVTVTGTLSASGNTSVGGTLSVTGATTLTGALTINGGIANNPTLTAGTANGVAYLNGSKVLTTGSALTFDGTNLVTTNLKATGLVYAGVSASSAGQVRVFNASNDKFLQIFNDGTVSVLNSTYGSSGASPLAFQISDSEQMRLTSTGLGIGTSSPSYKLHVVSASDYQGYFRNSATSTGALIGGVTGGGIITSDSSGTPLYLGIGGNTKATLDTSGNLGLGVTPSAWGSGKQAFENQGFAIWSGTTSNFLLGTNVYQNSGGSYIYKNTAAATMYYQNAGAHTWYTAPSGTAGNAISFAQSMTLDANTLQLGLTGASAAVKLAVQSAGTTSGYYATYMQNSAATLLFYLRGDGAFSTGVAAASPYNLTSASAANVVVGSDGILYRSTSSIKYKQEVHDATHGLAEVLALRPVTYKGNGVADGSKVFGGLIAEEVHAAGLTEFVQYAEDGTPDSLHYGHMVSLAFKALQELNAKFEAYKATHP